MPVLYTEDRYDSYTNKYLRKLSVKDWRDIRAGDLMLFVYCLEEAKMQRAVFNYLFPVYLNSWYDSLMVGYTNDLYFVLHRILAKDKSMLSYYLNEEQMRRLEKFFEDAFLDRFESGIDFSDTSFDILWLMRLNSVGYLSEAFPFIWNSMWSMPNVGSSVGVLYYISCLTFEGKEDNPFYYLFGSYMDCYENDIAVNDVTFLRSNLKFSMETMTYEYFGEKMKLCEMNLRDTKYNSTEFYLEHLWVGDEEIKILEPTSICAEIMKAYQLNEEIVSHNIRRVLGYFSTFGSG